MQIIRTFFVSFFAIFFKSKIDYLCGVRIYSDILEQWNRSNANAKYFAPVNGLMYFQIPCEVIEVQMVDIVQDSMILLAYDYAYGNDINGNALTNIVIDSANIPVSPFYLAFKCQNNDYYYSDQFCKLDPCDEFLQLEAMRGCEHDTLSYYHGPLLDATGTIPELQYTHNLFLVGSLSYPTLINTYDYRGACTIHINTKTEKKRYLRAFNIAPWYAEELINLLAAKAFLLDGKAFDPQDITIQPEKGTCLYYIDQELADKPFTFYAACLAECVISCDNLQTQLENLGIKLIVCGVESMIFPDDVIQLQITLENPNPLFNNTDFYGFYNAGGVLPYNAFSDPNTPLTVWTSSAIVNDNGMTLKYSLQGCEVCMQAPFSYQQAIALVDENDCFEVPFAVVTCDPCLETQGNILASTITAGITKVSPTEFDLEFLINAPNPIYNTALIEWSYGTAGGSFLYQDLPFVASPPSITASPAVPDGIFATITFEDCIFCVVFPFTFEEFDETVPPGRLDLLANPVDCSTCPPVTDLMETTNNADLLVVDTLGTMIGDRVKFVSQLSTTYTAGQNVPAQLIANFADPRLVNNEAAQWFRPTSILRYETIGGGVGTFNNVVDIRNDVSGGLVPADVIVKPLLLPNDFVQFIDIEISWNVCACINTLTVVGTAQQNTCNLDYTIEFSINGEPNIIETAPFTSDDIDVVVAVVDEGQTLTVIGFNDLTSGVCGAYTLDESLSICD